MIYLTLGNDTLPLINHLLLLFSHESHICQHSFTGCLISLSLAAMFLEHWKRRQISLNYSWDLTGMEEEEVRSHTYTFTLCYSLVFACLDYSAVAMSWFQWQCFFDTDRLKMTNACWMLFDATQWWRPYPVVLKFIPQRCVWMSSCVLSQKWTHQYVNLLFL